MKLIQIQYFLTVAECRSITKAAEQMFVSQPALSKQMNLLEEELGVQLMKRTSSGIVLTEIGEEFAKDCRIIIHDVDKAVSKAVNASNKTPGILRVGCFDGAVVEDFLPAFYAYFRKKAPGMQIKLGRNAFSENRKALDSDAIDMLIELNFPFVPEDPYLKGYETKVLSAREGAFIYSDNSPLAKKKKLRAGDFEKEICYVLSKKREGQLVMPALDTFLGLGIQNPKIEEVDNFATLMSNIKLGLGYSILSKMVADLYPGLRAFNLPEEFGLNVIAVWKKDNKRISGLMKAYK